VSLSHEDVAARDSPHSRGARSVAHVLRVAAFLLFVGSSAIIFLPSRAASLAIFNSTPQQHRTTSRQRRPTRAVTNAPARDYSHFWHSSAAHARRDCASCHPIASFAKPDITDFPDHPACVECHRQQFFRGARPTICSDCHLAVSPRTGARFNFPKPSEPAEFADVFPHVNHIKTTSLIRFKQVIGEKSNIQATCLYCHKPSSASPLLKQSSNPAAFIPPAGTYMTTPTTHASCFQCHWQKGVANHEEEPYAAQCASCHRNIAAGPPDAANVSASHDSSRTRAELALSVNPASRVAPSSFLTARAVALLPRVTPKFVHETEAHKKKLNDEGKEVAITCLQCHTAVRKAATLESLRLKENGVGLLTCSSSACHTAVAGTAQLHLSVYRELRERGKEAKFDCTLCHVPPQSLAAEVPCTHYAAVLASATKEKKSTKGIEQLTPPRCADELKRSTQ
jgi:hypothetical protein